MIYKTVIILSLGIAIGCTTQMLKRIDNTYYNRTDLHSIAEHKYGFKLQENQICTFMLDSMYFDSTGLDTILRKYNRSEIGSIIFFQTKEESIMYSRNCDLVVHIRTKNQTREEKANLLEESQSVFNESIPKIKITDYKCSDCPLLIINNTLITNPYERKKRLNNLTADKIEYIVRIDQELNTRTYAGEGRNGIIEITLK